jgi:hypothetical protein
MIAQWLDVSKFRPIYYVLNVLLHVRQIITVLKNAVSMNIMKCRLKAIWYKLPATIKPV